MYTRKMTIEMLEAYKYVKLPTDFELEKRKYSRQEVKEMIDMYKKEEEAVPIVEVKETPKSLLEEVVINEEKEHCIIERQIVQGYPMFQGKEVSTGKAVFFLDVCGWVYKTDLEYFRKKHNIDD